jgi:hypothetical protein
MTEKGTKRQLLSRRNEFIAAAYQRKNKEDPGNFNPAEFPQFRNVDGSSPICRNGLNAPAGRTAGIGTYRTYTDWAFRRKLPHTTQRWGRGFVSVLRCNDSFLAVLSASEAVPRTDVHGTAKKRHSPRAGETAERAL